MGVTAWAAGGGWDYRVYFKEAVAEGSRVRTQGACEEDCDSRVFGRKYEHM
jgi:hypothetical protein